MIYKVLAFIGLCISSVSFNSNAATIDTVNDEVSNQIFLYMRM